MGLNLFELKTIFKSSCIKERGREHEWVWGLWITKYFDMTDVSARATLSLTLS
jgi:hypothetical protein